MCPVFPIYNSLHLERVKGRNGGVTDECLQPMDDWIKRWREGGERWLI